MISELSVAITNGIGLKKSAHQSILRTVGRISVVGSHEF